MPVFDQGYRRFEGTLRPRHALGALVWTAVRPRLRWWLWLLAAILSFYPGLVYAAITFITLAVGPDAFGGRNRLPEASGAFVAFSDNGDPSQLVAELLAPTTAGIVARLWRISEQCALAGFVLPAVACAGVIATDRATGAHQIYFARPVTRMRYLLSRIAAVTVFCSVATVLPPLLVWLETAALHDDPWFAAQTWSAPFAIALSGAVYAYFVSGVVLALSSTLRRPLVVGLATIFSYLFLQVVSAMIVHGLEDKRWRALDPQYALGGITAPLYGVALPDWLQTPWPWLVGLVVPTLLLAYVWSRLRAVEVAT